MRTCGPDNLDFVNPSTEVDVRFQDYDHPSSRPSNRLEHE
jgi:hypothetical protein